MGYCTLKNTTHGTYPCVFHAPDWQKNFWWKRLQSLSCQHDFRGQTCPDLTIMTWNNLDKGAFEVSLEAQDIPYICKGKDAKEWSHYLKPIYNLEVLKSVTTPYVMACDSHDVILLRSPKTIVDLFLSKKCKMLFNSEVRFYPDIDEPLFQGWRQYYEKICDTRYRYLNSGMWIAERKFGIEFFNEVKNYKVHELTNCEKHLNLNEASFGSDQCSTHHVFPQFYPYAKLDYKCEIFQNAANVGLDEDLRLLVKI